MNNIEIQTWVSETRAWPITSSHTQLEGVIWWSWWNNSTLCWWQPGLSSPRYSHKIWATLCNVKYKLSINW